MVSDLADDLFIQSISSRREGEAVLFTVLIVVLLLFVMWILVSGMIANNFQRMRLHERGSKLPSRRMQVAMVMFGPITAIGYFIVQMALAMTQAAHAVYLIVTDKTQGSGERPS